MIHMFFMQIHYGMNFIPIYGHASERYEPRLPELFNSQSQTQTTMVFRPSITSLVVTDSISFRMRRWEDNSRIRTVKHTHTHTHTTASGCSRVPVPNLQ